MGEKAVRTEDAAAGDKMGAEMRRIDSLNIEAGKVSTYDGFHRAKVPRTIESMLLHQLVHVSIKKTKKLVHACSCFFFLGRI